MIHKWQKSIAMWKLRHSDAKFLQALLDTKAQDEDVTDAQVRKILLGTRAAVALAPYRDAVRRFLYIFKLGWEIVNGRYRKPSTQDNSGAHQAPGGGAGAFGQPVAQAGYGYPLAVPPAFAVPTGPGGLNASGGASSWPSSRAVPLDDGGIVGGEIVAYRCWRLKVDGLLHSVYQDHICWTPGAIMSGDVNAGEGVHAFKSIILMGQYAGMVDGCVTGTVYLWGEVHEHERGYRATCAAVRSIDDSPHYDAKALRKLYGLNKRKKKS
jgi:hypothetical protein